uniref:Amidase domain-containing protein n=1 Tax=Nelumbo nucifera TaxID=4432 RepID=A0A822ZEA6_NELNU|nr:TPA_asm: hypothetical protein HUJ06_001060 [Nelumbo nucifera]
MAFHCQILLQLVLSHALLILIFSGLISTRVTVHGFSIKEANVDDLQLAFQQNKLTSRQLVEFYLGEISRLNPLVHGVIEVNPDALYQADKADGERKAKAPGWLSELHGIPVLVKDNIATKDKLNTTAGSSALLGSVVPRDAGVVKRLRDAGVVILGKASLTEWSDSRSLTLPDGWSARGGPGLNPYVLSASPCGSSSGSAISVAANMVAVSLGTETRASMICPANANSVVAIKPTVGLTSRAGIIPISLRQDSIGPICRTVSDAVYVLEAIVGFDENDAEATKQASKFIPHGGYKQFLKPDGLKGKRLGITRIPFLNYPSGSVVPNTNGCNLEINNIHVILNVNQSGEATALVAELKLALNSYLKDLVVSPVRSLAEVIAFNKKFSDLMTKSLEEYGQGIFLVAERTKGIGPVEKAALLNLQKLSRDGFEKLMIDNELDAVVTPGADFAQACHLASALGD